MIEGGELVGKTPEFIDRGCAMLEDELRYRIGVALSLLEPLALLTIGSLVGVFLLSLLSPMAQLLQNL